MKPTALNAPEEQRYVVTPLQSSIATYITTRAPDEH